MRRHSLLSATAATALLFGLASGAAAATNDLPAGSVQMAQDSGAGAGGGAGDGAGANGGADTTTGPQTDVEKSGSDAGADQPSTTGQTGTTATGTQEMGATTPMTQEEWTARADEIIGQPIVNQNGEEIGDIEDLVVNPQDDSVHAVVGVGGFLGMGERQVAIPADQIQFSGDQAQLMTMGTSEELSGMPEYTEGQWQSLQGQQGQQ